MKNKKNPSKRSKKTGYQKNLYLRVISHIKEHNKLPDLGISKQLRDYYIKRLKLDGVIEKKGYGLWTVNIDRWDQIRFIKEVKKQGNDTRSIRGHGFHFRIAIPRIKNWGNRGLYMDRKNILYTESKALWKGQRLIINDYKVWLHDRSIVIYCPKGKSFFNYTANLSLINALSELKSIIRKVERILGVDLKINKNYHWRVSKQHYAKIKDDFAKLMNRDHSRFVCRYKGEEWFCCDRSFNFNERETIHPKTAVMDQDNILEPYFNDLKDHYEKTGEILTMSGFLQIINKQQEMINSLIYKAPEKLDKRDSYFM